MKYKLWTDFAVSASQTESNCVVMEVEGLVSVCLLSDVGPGDLIVPDREYSHLLTPLCLTDRPLDLSSPLYHQLSPHKLTPRYRLTLNYISNRRNVKKEGYKVKLTEPNQTKGLLSGNYVGLLD